MDSKQIADIVHAKLGTFPNVWIERKVVKETLTEIFDNINSEMPFSEDYFHKDTYEKHKYAWDKQITLLNNIINSL